MWPFSFVRCLALTVRVIALTTLSQLSGIAHDERGALVLLQIVEQTAAGTLN